mgnify:CR=1 FL=1
MVAGAVREGGVTAMCAYCEPDHAGNFALLRDEPDRSAPPKSLDAKP